jgi:hypothetical protein
MDEIQAKLNELNAVLGATVPFKLGLFDPNQLETLKQNARYMRNDMFAQLVANVKRDKALSSAPLVYAANGSTAKPKVLSGNHRVLAARAAGLPRVLCLVVDNEKSAEEQIAIQLSHNAISGADDLQELKRLYEEVRDIELKSYSGLDEDTIKQLNSIKFDPVSEPRLQFKTVTFLFLPSELIEIQALGEEVDKILRDKHSYLFQKRDYLEFFNLLATAKEKLDIRNSAVAILELMRAGMSKIEGEHATEAA